MNSSFDIYEMVTNLIIERLEKGFPVVFWKLLDKEDKDGNIDRILFLRYCAVFNLKQTEGIDERKISSTEAYDHDFDPIDQAIKLIECWSD